MGYRILDVTIISAEGLNDVNFMSKMDVYVTASIAGVQKLTHVDKRGGTSPKWNHHMRFSVAETAANLPHRCLLFTLRSDHLLGDKDIGYVSVPLGDLLAGATATAAEHIVEYQVQKPSGGKPKGTFKFSYRFHCNFAPPSAAAPLYADPFNAAAAKKDQEPLCAAVPAKGQEAGTAYPPNIGASGTGAAPAGVAYNPPPPAYAYPAPAQAYPAANGYPQPQVQKKKNYYDDFVDGFLCGLIGGCLLEDAFDFDN